MRILAPTGQAVLNADDPIVVKHVAPLAAAPIIWFSMSSVAPMIEAARAAGGTTLFVRDEELYISQDDRERRLLAVSELPLALGGIARHNVSNALAAAGALHALGLSDGQIVLGLASFQPSVRDNPGRLNQFHRAGVTVVMDYAHNSDGLRVLLHSAVPLKALDGRLWVIYSGTGDRTDAQISEQGAIIGALADRFILRHDSEFLRGRSVGEMEPLLRAAALDAGLAPTAIIEVEGDTAALDCALSAARSGDVIAFTVYRDRSVQIERLQQWEANE